ncbi:MULTISPECIES: diaminobutyrate acetyltransferase [Nocardiopsidaceae]|uniref:L-2,4-diaminobutyric acid acetyltransferase n=1 Tax=Streptomonospora salina TaxID=104205 RepID=A0A841E8B8_9ACTN|nr:L-2,4-diaminobutyric acid acetyltransferase [Streptomonospora salina]
MPDEQSDDETSAVSDPGDQPAVVGGPAASDGLLLQEPTVADGPDLWRLARDSGLDMNSPYAYTLWSRDFAATSVIARDSEHNPRGFVTGFVRPAYPETYFLWQVGVDPGFRGRRLARRMLDHIGDRIAELGLTYLEATVTPDNAASRALFESFARSRECTAVWSPLFGSEHFPADDGEGHEPEDLVRIGPLGRPGADRSTSADI